VPSPESRAVIRDVDGTLVDSLECHWHAWHEALNQERDYVRTRERFESIVHALACEICAV
jgi:beta-phosphoglucomutase-like phosphatase (HAD superfamily)